MPARRGTLEENRTAARRIGWGALFGLAAAVLAIGIPSIAIFLVTLHPGGALAFGTGLVELSGGLVLAGALLYILSLFLYRRSFAALRRLDAEFALASALCLVGSVGFVLLLVAATVLAGTASSLQNCLAGHPSHALACLASNAPLGAYTAIAGFVLGWLGGLGVVFGLWLAGSHYQRRGVDLGAVLYLFFLLVLLVPFFELAASFTGGNVFLLVVPLASVLAPLFVLIGIRFETRPAGAPPTA